MSVDDLVKLECGGPATIRALASRLQRHGPAEGQPEWLVSAIWLCTDNADYLATSSTKVLSDGYIARPLAVHRVDEFLRQVRNELPDIEARLVARTGDAQLPELARPLRPTTLQECPGPALSTSVLIRVSERASSIHRVACGLLFRFDGGRSLLVGTDLGTAAMVLSDDDELIGRYASDCEALAAEEYVSRYAP